MSAAIIYDTGSAGVICAPDYTSVITYTWWLAGPDGASFEIHPVKGVHSREQIAAAKSALRSERDVVSIHVKPVEEVTLP